MGVRHPFLGWVLRACVFAQAAAKGRNLLYLDGRPVQRTHRIPMPPTAEKFAPQCLPAEASAAAGPACRWLSRVTLHPRLLVVGLVVLAMGSAGALWLHVPGLGYRVRFRTARLANPEVLDPNNAIQREAVALADRLIRDFPDDLEVLYTRGLILNKFVNREEAARCWQECLQYDPDFAEAHYDLGKALFKMGQYEEALVSLRRAVELKASPADTRVQLADALISLGRPAEVIPVMMEQVREAPEETAGWFYLGHAYFLLGEYDRAAELYVRALDRNPRCHQAWHGLARVCQKRGQAQRARECLRLVTLFQGEFFQRHHERKRRDFGELDTLEGALAGAYSDAGRIYLARGNVAVAEECWNKAAGMDPMNITSRVALLRLYSDSGRAEAMRPLLEQLCKIEPDNPVHFRNLGVYLSSQGDAEQAEAALRRFVELAPDQADACSTLAEFYLHAGRKLSEALALARRAVALDPTAAHYFLLSRACAASGDRAGMLTAIGRAIELDPGNAQYRQYQAQATQGQ